MTVPNSSEGSNSTGSGPDWESFPEGGSERERQEWALSQLRDSIDATKRSFTKYCVAAEKLREPVEPMVKAPHPVVVQTAQMILDEIDAMRRELDAGKIEAAYEHAARAHDLTVGDLPVAFVRAKADVSEKLTRLQDQALRVAERLRQQQDPKRKAHAARSKRAAQRRGKQKKELIAIACRLHFAWMKDKHSNPSGRLPRLLNLQEKVADRYRDDEGKPRSLSTIQKILTKGVLEDAGLSFR